MRKWLITVLSFMLLLTGCTRYSPVSELPEVDGTKEMTADEAGETGGAETSPAVVQIDNGPLIPERTAVKVKGIYISGKMAGAGEPFQNILNMAEKTEINAVVVDVKDDEGRITFSMDNAPTVAEIGASKCYIQDIHAFVRDLKSRGFYVIARVVAFRDPYLAEKKPEWSLRDQDGGVHRDSNGLAWVNPFKQEVWDYLVEVGRETARVGFDEIQFDYIRFATDSTMKNVVFDEADTRGRSKTDAITEFIRYAYDNLSQEGVFVSADVFGSIIGSQVDADSVGQIYAEMAANLDYICPMIYPSHYRDGNFGIEHPDKQPYETILAALQGSRQNLIENRNGRRRQASVRPWLQDFTASYLENHIKYGPEQVRAEIQAVYDAGYDEWILWSASNKYTWDALLTPEEAAAEKQRIDESRAALALETGPETTAAPAQQ